MAQDNVEVMASLGFKQFFVAGHDRGARVTHRMCLDHPDKVERAAMRKLFLEGRLKPLHQEVRSEVEQLLVRSRS